MRGFRGGLLAACAMGAMLAGALPFDGGELRLNGQAVNLIFFKL